MLKLKLQYFGHLMRRTWLIWKDPDAGKDWGREEKGTAEDEMVGWHHRLNGHGFGWTLGVGDGQGGLACCSPWGRKELDTTEWLDWAELNWDYGVVQGFKPTLTVSICKWSHILCGQKLSYKYTGKHRNKRLTNLCMPAWVERTLTEAHLQDTRSVYSNCTSNSFLLQVCSPASFRTNIPEMCLIFCSDFPHCGKIYIVFVILPVHKCTIQWY